MKPGVSVEFMFKISTFHSDDIDNKYKLGGAIGYYGLKPTQDTFRTYAVGGDLNGNIQLLPGYEVIHKYHAAYIGITNDYAFMGGKKFSPVIGADLYFFIISIDEDDYAETLEQSNSTGNDEWAASFNLRAGAQYKISDNWLLSAGVGRNMRYAGSTPYQTYWKTFISISYYAQ